MERAAVTFFIRVLLGIIFFMQGLGKLTNWGFENLYNNGFKSFEDTFLPTFIIKFAAYYTTYVELIGGFLLIIGLGRKYAMLALALVLLIVSFGHGLQSPVWNVTDVLFRSILLAPLMLFPQDWDKWHLDHFLNKRKS